MPESPRTCVIYNPAAGRGRAARLIEGRSRDELELRPTSRAGEAEESALRAAKEGFVRVIATGGDGTVHEVANGLLRSGEPDVILSVWPFGSANDYAHALGITTDRAQPIEVQRVDVGRITGGGRERYFVNGLGVGFNGAVTAEARRIRWLRGVPLYSLAVFRSLVRHFDKPITAVRLDDATRQAPTLALTLNLGRREGGFPITPAADLSDGLFDYMHAGPVSRWELLRHFPNLIRGTLPADHPRMWMGRCRRLELESEAPLRIHLDGEFFCTPENNVRSVSVELLPRRLRVECGVPLASRSRTASA
jgi:diacylglycerol kinase family enzyme